MAADPEKLWNIANDLLDAVTSHYTSKGVGLPLRQYVANGPPVYDCEQLTVFCERTAGYEEDPAAAISRHHAGMPGWAMRAGYYAIGLVRCAPTIDDQGKPPSVDRESGSAQEIMRDAGLMLNGLITAYRTGLLPGCTSLSFLQWDCPGAQGGYASGILHVAVGLAHA